ncbi:MAG: tRNA (guanosine(37)-N1)-methyltransferase TrmD [Rhodococcus sp. (in: high G+C Gram-positive bacteria)]|uniref:tRNA (guanosine(37)-N1)-methyltransferase TrmD n=1 Tax=Rhodococcus sp. TaxID=1831 RepID=UPI003BB62E4A
MRLDVVTIFPEYLEPLRAALLGKAIDKGVISVGVHNLRDWTHDVHKAVDDSPYGGGPGMVMKPTVWGPALDDVLAGRGGEPDAGGDLDSDVLLVVPTPAGVPFTQATAHRWSGEKHIVFACGRYEGIDQRVFDDAARRVRVEEVSIGDYVLIGGEVAVLVMVEAVVRLLPGVLGNQQSHQEDSFSDGLLEGPSYTRPARWRDLDVPAVLMSGDHAKVAQWRREQSLIRTRERRPDLLPDES